MTEAIRKSLIILKRLSNQLLNAKNALLYISSIKKSVWQDSNRKEEIFPIDTSMYCVLFYSFITYCSFVDEYYGHLISTAESEISLLNDTKRRCKPLFKKVTEEFGDLKKARNYVLAHGYRNISTPLEDSVINEYFNQLVNKYDFKTFFLLSNTTVEVVNNLEAAFGKISDKDIML